MKKIIVLGLVLAMALSLSVAANAAFAKDTDWALFMQAGNNTWSSATSNWGSAGAAIQLGNSSTPASTGGTAMTGTSTAYVRDMSGNGTLGYVVSTKAAADQGPAEVIQTWNDIRLFLGSAYATTTTASLRIWTTGIGSADGPRIVLSVLQATGGKAATGFAVGDVLFDSATAVPDETVDTSKHYPWTTINIQPYITGLRAANIDGAPVKFQLQVITPAQQTQVTPEPGSMVALFSGLVGLVGFGIRRRK